MRIFYAVNFADYVKQALIDNLTEIKKYTLRGSFTARENFHITLVFVGECAPNKLKPFETAADETVKKLELPELFKTTPIRATIDKLGTFTHSGEELLWAGVKTTPGDILSKINRTINEELAKRGIFLKQDHSVFIPHVTIARRVEFLRITNKELDRIKFSPIDFTINSITLMESAMSFETNGDRRYTKILYKPLYEKKF